MVIALDKLGLIETPESSDFPTLKSTISRDAATAPLKKN
jgi:hypothetical protein